MMSADERRQLRERWPLNIYRRGQEPHDDLSGTTTPEERVQMVVVLSSRAWELSGNPSPRTTRSAMPIVVRQRP